ncbi:MAG: hypothetical protein KTR19_00455 [Hyphomicrobiales bacterium]|nr:hypothetical protein [Hyphomicrobiales bacterium]
MPSAPGLFQQAQTGESYGCCRRPTWSDAFDHFLLAITSVMAALVCGGARDLLTPLFPGDAIRLAETAAG